MKENGVDEVMPLNFITGVPRSGTTLVANALNVSEYVFVPKETHYFEYLGRKAALLGKFYQRKRNRIIHKVFKENNLKQSSNLDGLENNDLLSVYCAMLEKILENTKASIVIEKTPNHYRFVPFIAKYNKVRLVHVIRDPRDVYLSRSKVPWGINSARNISCEFNRSCDIAKKLMCNPNVDILVLRYEDIIEEPKGALLKICAHFGIHYSQSMLNPKDTGNFDVSEEPWKAKNLKAIDAKNKSKWLRHSDSYWCVYIENRCKINLREHAYPVEGTKLNSVDWLNVFIEHFRSMILYFTRRLH